MWGDRPSAFADIVEQRRNVENPGLVPARRQVGSRTGIRGHVLP